MAHRSSVNAVSLASLTLSPPQRTFSFHVARRDNLLRQRRWRVRHVAGMVGHHAVLAGSMSSLPANLPGRLRQALGRTGSKAGGRVKTIHLRGEQVELLILACHRMLLVYQDRDDAMARLFLARLHETLTLLDAALAY